MKSLRNYFLLISLSAAGCHHEKKATELAVFSVTNPSRQDLEATQRYVCQIRSIQHIELRALERGYLQKIFVDEGQSVKKGDRLFQVLPTMYQAEMQKAQAEADFSQIEFENTKVLADRTVVSPNELALSKAKLEKAKAELAVAKVHRDFTEVKAPFDGIIGRFQVRLGSLVSESDLMTTLADNSKMWVYFNVTEAEYLDFRSRGDDVAVKLQMANGKIFDQEGKIETIEADFNHETGTIAFRATFPNPTGLLRHGETGTILMPRSLKNALVVAQKSTFELLDKRYVYVVDGSKAVRAKQVVVAEELPHLFVIKEGLSENDRVVLDGLSRLKEGDTVETKFVPPADALAHLDVPAE